MSLLLFLRVADKKYCWMGFHEILYWGYFTKIWQHVPTLGTLHEDIYARLHAS